jgi:hypothetical protein
MPDVFMDVDVYLTNVPINMLPLTDDADFKTIETGIVWNQAGMDLVWNFVATAGTQSKTDITLSAAGSHTLTHLGNGMYAISVPGSGGDSISNDAEGFGWFTGVCDGVLPWRSPVICFRATGLNNKLIDDAYSATRGLVGTSVPDAVAGAAGGLPLSISGVSFDDILADTNEIQGDLENGGRLDTILDELTTQGDTNETKLDTIVADTNEIQADITNGGRVDLILDELTVQGDTNETKIDTIDTVVDSIKTITDSLQVKKNTAIAKYLFLMVDETDGRTGKTGLTITAERSIDGAAFAACANSATELSAGVYIIDLAASDLNGDTIMLKFSSSGADTRLISIVTVP